MPDYRSEEAKEYRRLYNGKAWKSLRLEVLMDEPFCKFCDARGKVEPSTVVDHIVPHRGDLELFYDRDNLQGLCAPCHDGHKATIERLGYSLAGGLDGLPLDPNHPVWRRD